MAAAHFQIPANGKPNFEKTVYECLYLALKDHLELRSQSVLFRKNSGVCDACTYECERKEIISSQRRHNCCSVGERFWLLYFGGAEQVKNTASLLDWLDIHETFLEILAAKFSPPGFNLGARLSPLQLRAAVSENEELRLNFLDFCERDRAETAAKKRESELSQLLSDN